MRELREKIGIAMRKAYNAQTVGRPRLTPWETAETRNAWLACADAALSVIESDDDILFIRALAEEKPD